MTTRAPLDSRTLELLSAYLDGTLAVRERTDLETRLNREPALRAELEELRAVRGLLRSLPLLQSPRPLTLNRGMMGIRNRREDRSRPAAPAWPFAFGSALAACAFVFLAARSLAAGGLAPGAAQAANAPQTFSALNKNAEDNATALAGEPAPTNASPLLASTAPPAAESTPLPLATGAGPVATESTPEATQSVLRSQLLPTPSAAEGLYTALVQATQETSTSSEPLNITLIIEVFLAMMTFVLGGIAVWIRRRNR